MAKKIYGPRSITLKYRINGATFRLRYPPEEWRFAFERAQALLACGVAVQIRGWPKKVVIAIPPLSEMRARD